MSEQPEATGETIKIEQDNAGMTGGDESLPPTGDTNIMIEETVEVVEETVEVKKDEAPADTTEKPAETTEQPAETTEQPAEATEQPAETTEQPAEATEQPAETTEQPPEPPKEEAESKPEEEKEEPKEEDQQPEEDVKEDNDKIDLDEFLGVKNCLTVEIIAENLDDINRTVDGLSYVYTSLNLNKLKLEHLGNALLLYKHLRYITMVNNKIKDINCIAKLPQLVSFDASKNKIESIEFLGDENGSLQFLKTLNLSSNSIEVLPHINPPCLTNLNLNSNKISDCSMFKGHNEITFLAMNNNQLATCDGLHLMPKLHTLSLANNPFTSTSGLKELNKLPYSLESESEQVEEPLSLKYLDLNQTKIEKLEELNTLTKFINLKDLNLQETPLEETLADGLKKEILIILEDLKITIFNKEEVTEEDYTEAKELKMERIKEEEERRREAELAAQENQEDS